MCKMLYVGASEPLPIIAWNEDSPGFHVTELRRELDQKVCCQFTHSHVFYIGSYEWCGCGFTLDQHQDDESQSLQAKKSLADLAIYLEEALSKGISIQLFYCWDGEQADLVNTHGQVKPSDVSNEGFCFEEMQLFEVKREIPNRQNKDGQ